MQFAKSEGWNQVISEGDAKSCFDAINKHGIKTAITIRGHLMILITTTTKGYVQNEVEFKMLVNNEWLGYYKGYMRNYIINPING